MKTITNIVILISVLFIMASMIYEALTLFLTATTVFYIAGIGAIYMAITGAKKDIN